MASFLLRPPHYCTALQVYGGAVPSNLTDKVALSLSQVDPILVSCNQDEVIAVFILQCLYVYMLFCYTVVIWNYLLGDI